MKYDAVIIGGGVAGVTCAVQLRILGLMPVIIEKRAIGGMVSHAYSVNNIPFISDSIKGENICSALCEALKRHDIKVINGNVNKVQCRESVHVVYNDTQKVKGDYAVIATGSYPRRPSYEIPDHNSVRFFPVKGEKLSGVAVIGGGDVAFDYALSMSERCSDITIYARNTVKANEMLKREVKRRGISVRKGDVKSISILQDKPLLHLKNGECAMPDMILIAIGREPVLPEIEAGNEHDRILFAGDVRGENGMIARAYNDALQCAMQIHRRKINGRHSSVKE